MINRLLLLLAIGIVCVACADKSTTPDDSVQFENKEFIKATIGGNSYSSGIVIQQGRVGDDGKMDFSLRGTDLAGLQLSVAFTSATTGTFTFGDGSGSASMSTMQNVGGSLAIYTGTDGTLTVDKIDMTAKRAKGRFSGTLKASTGETLTVTDGTFEGDWN